MFSVTYPETASGFSFENCRRNALLETKGLSIPKATKTGTTIVGITYKDGVILGADTRATEDTTVADKNCEKIHYLASNMYCCGAGTAADTETTTQMISSQLELHQLYTGRVCRVATANQMLKQYLFRYQGYIGAALILGGVDLAMAVFESGWNKDIDEEAGIKLVRDAIAAGVFNDLGSGSNIDVCIIRKGSTDYRRTYDEANKKGVRQQSYRYPRGTTRVLSTKVLDVEEVSVQRVEPERMDTA
ncbi:hypothetical protein NQ317_007741 [Molorchus minor]|uniref:Proteasome subunit beta n=1 Tax=Molorchus minor TaxID=1323400 RepID=A0ABQ9JW06_9CUCU|nr:hypothetical protein NQ317_007741 [Molorchus minor]